MSDNSKNFFVPLNLPDVSHEIDLSVYPYFEGIRQQYGKNDFLSARYGFKIPNTIYSLFKKLNLTVCVDKTLLFAQDPYQHGEIHIDNVLADPKLARKSRQWAINWVYGGDTIMSWYEYRGDDVPPPGFVHYYQKPVLSVAQKEQSHLIHSTVLTGANLVNVGVWHNTQNPSSIPRYCISACAIEHVTYDEIVQLLASKKGILREN